MARYDLEYEIPNPIDSGSDIQHIRTVKTQKEAIQAYQNHQCNRITKYEHINGKLITTLYDETTHGFV